MGGAAAVVLATGGWLAYTADRASTDLRDFRDTAAQIRDGVAAGDAEVVRPRLRALQAQAGAAHDRTHDPVWAVTSRVPWLGRPFRTTRGVSEAARELARDVLPPAVDAVERLHPSRIRRGAQVDVAAIAAVRPAAASASAHAEQVRRRVERLATSTWLHPADSARAKVAVAVTEIAQRMRDLELTAQLVPDLLGAAGPRRYFLAFQNNAEARATGGLPGSFGILLADHGRLTMERTGSDTDIGTFPRDVLDLGAEFRDRYDDLGAARTFGNSNVTAHFPYAARIWTEMWLRRSGQRVDGAMAVDPVALSYLLRGSGPVTAVGGRRLTADNVVSYLERDIYAEIPDVARRKALLPHIARDVFQHVVAAPARSSRSLVDGLHRAIRERRLLVASGRSAEQTLLETTPVGGAVPDAGGPYARVVLNNAAGSKLDYYVRTSVRYEAGPCVGATRASTVTIRVDNTAPGRGLPAYVTIRADTDRPVAPGSERLLVSLYATRGAEVVDVRRDGRTSGVTGERERGRPVYTADVDIAAGASTTLVLSLREPTVAGPAVLPPFPGVLRGEYTAAVPVCRGG